MATSSPGCTPGDHYVSLTWCGFNAFWVDIECSLLLTACNSNKRNLSFWCSSNCTYVNSQDHVSHLLRQLQLFFQGRISEIVDSIWPGMQNCKLWDATNSHAFGHFAFSFVVYTQVVPRQVQEPITDFIPSWEQLLLNTESHLNP